jgi:hypothetical protein
MNFTSELNKEYVLEEEGGVGGGLKKTFSPISPMEWAGGTL